MTPTIIILMTVPYQRGFKNIDDSRPWPQAYVHASEIRPGAHGKHIHRESPQHL